MAKRFERILEAATDQTLIEPNWEGILDGVDMIRGNEVPVKEALKIIQKRYKNPNPHVAHHALLVLEACVKNCGKKFHLEIATKEFMDDLKGLVIAGSPDNVKQKVLELIQCWSSAFRNSPEYSIVCDTHNLLKMNGFEFPAIDEAKAMFLSDSAPDWAEGDNCYRCRTEFGVFTRKHHCRACGQIFCDRCSNKQMLLPQFGIEKKVRVCESCFDKNLASSATKTSKTLAKDSSDKTASSADSDAAAASEKARKEAEEREQEELLLALALSQSEAEAKEQEKQRQLYKQYNGGGNSDSGVKPQTASSENAYQSKLYMPNVNPGPALEDLNATQMENDEQEPPVDSMLAKYLDRDYWERKRRGEETGQQLFKATAPPPSEVSISLSSSVSQRPPNEPATSNGYDNSNPPTPTTTLQQPFPDPINNNNFSGAFAAKANLLQGDKQQSQSILGQITPIAIADTSDDGRVAETQQFCNTSREKVDIMSMRMRSNQLRGRSIVNDSAIHSLFTQLTDLHANVLDRMGKLEDERAYYEGLQDNLGHIHEARQAVNALREEHERQRQEQQREEQNRRQTQLQMKLELMRHKKHEMLLNERHAALQRFQEHEQQLRQQRLQQQQQQQSMTPPVGRLPQLQQQPTTAYQQQHPYMPQQPQFMPQGHQPQQMYIPQQQQYQQLEQPQNPTQIPTTAPQQQFQQFEHPAQIPTALPQHQQQLQDSHTMPSQYVQQGHQQMYIPTSPQQLHQQMPFDHLSQHPAQMPFDYPPQHPAQITAQQHPAHLISTMAPSQQLQQDAMLPPQHSSSFTAVPEDLLISFD